MSTTLAHHRRKKLVNAIAYFAAHTAHCGQVKIFKLLNFLDFEHYRQTGKSVTGMRYQALTRGPAPAVETYGYIQKELKKHKGKQNVIYDEDWFTPRELTIMKRLVEMFHNANSQDMIGFSHKPRMPWRKFYGKGEGLKREIPYELALQSLPIVKEEPTIDEEERVLLRDAFEALGLER